MRELLAKKRVIQPVQVGDQTYYVKSLSVSGILRYSELVKDDKTQAGMMAALLRLCGCDAEGNDCFTDDDLPALRDGEAGGELMKLFNAAADIAGMSEGKLDAAKKD